MTSLPVSMPLLLPGFMFPAASMPDPLQWLALANPPRHRLGIVRGALLEGAGLEAPWPRILYLHGDVIVPADERRIQASFMHPRSDYRHGPR